MDKRKFLVSRSISFRILAEHLVQDEDFVSDALTVLDIDDANFETLANGLRDSEAFLDRKTLSTIVEQVLGKADRSDTISHLVWRLNEMVRDADEPLQTAIAAFRHAVDETLEQKSEGDRKKLGERIERLVCTPPGFARQHKAQELTEATGAELDELQIICDIRPVFDEERSKIEGAIPVSTLIVDVVQTDGTSSRIQVRLNEQEVADLLSKAEFAKAKLAVIRRMLKDKSITLPATSATIDERPVK